jgi:hypothetical protein
MTFRQDSPMDWSELIRQIIEIIKKIFGKKEEKKDEYMEPRVEFYWDVVLKEGTGTPQRELPANSYEVEIDGSTQSLAKDTHLNIDLGFIELRRKEDGLPAVEWGETGLRQLKLSYEADVEFTYGDNGVVKKKVLGSNADALLVSVFFPKGYKLSGMTDMGYFYAKHPIEFTVKLPALDNLHIAYKYSETGNAIGYVGEKTYKVTAWLIGTAKIPQKEEGKKDEDKDTRPPLIIYQHDLPLIRTSPRIKDVINEIVEVSKSLNPNVPTNLSGANPYLLIEIDDALVQTDVYVAVKVNGNYVAVFNSMIPYRRVITPIEFGKEYDIDVTFVVDKAVMPHAIYNPTLEIQQSKLSAWGWEYERHVASVRGNYGDALLKGLPIGHIGYRLVVDRENRSYVARIGALDVGREEWILRGKMLRYENSFILNEFRVISRVEGKRVSEDLVSPEERIKLKAIFYGEKTDWTVQGPVTIDGLENLWVYKDVEFYSDKSTAFIFEDIPNAEGVKKVKIEAVGLLYEKDGRNHTWSYAPTIDEVVYTI